MANFLLAPEPTIECELTEDVFQKETFDEEWSLMVDGASNKHGASVGVVLITLDGSSIEAVVKLDFHASNNKAEYKALLSGLLMALEVRVRRICVYTDSMLIVSQINGEYNMKDERMVRYKEKVDELFKRFDAVRIEKVSR